MHASSSNQWTSARVGATRLLLMAGLLAAPCAPSAQQLAARAVQLPAPAAQLGLAASLSRHALPYAPPAPAPLPSRRAHVLAGTVIGLVGGAAAFAVWDGLRPSAVRDSDFYSFNLVASGLVGALGGALLGIIVHDVRTELQRGSRTSSTSGQPN